MAVSRDEVFEKALSLQYSDRADLIDVLIRSLDAEVEEDWRLEIDRRAQEIESGTVKSISWEVIRERLARAPRG